MIGVEFIILITAASYNQKKAFNLVRVMAIFFVQRKWLQFVRSIGNSSVNALLESIDPVDIDVLAYVGHDCRCVQTLKQTHGRRELAGLTGGTQGARSCPERQYYSRASCNPGIRSWGRFFDLPNICKPAAWLNRTSPSQVSALLRRQTPFSTTHCRCNWA